MIYVYRRGSSSGARLLAEALGGRRWRGAMTPRLVPGDVVVCWGEGPPAVPAGVRVINGVVPQSKFTEARRLKEAGVSTIEVRDQAPTTAADPALEAYAALAEMLEEFPTVPPTDLRGQVMQNAMRQLVLATTNLGRAVVIPAPVLTPGEWLPRDNAHVGGNDLLDAPDEPDYWSKKLALTSEVRVHSFDGRSIRAGVKAPREGMVAHPWIRSWDAGWRIRYDGVSAKQAQRDLAHTACRALGLTFGAVDIGLTATGPVVLEVNRAPGLEGGTVEVYARAIQALLAGNRAAA